MGPCVLLVFRFHGSVAKHCRYPAALPVNVLKKIRMTETIIMEKNTNKPHIMTRFHYFRWPKYIEQYITNVTKAFPCQQIRILDLG
jgi:hypothetical protein